MTPPKPLGTALHHQADLPTPPGQLPIPPQTQEIVVPPKTDFQFPNGWEKFVTEPSMQNLYAVLKNRKEPLNVCRVKQPDEDLSFPRTKLQSHLKTNWLYQIIYSFLSNVTHVDITLEALPGNQGKEGNRYPEFFCRDQQDCPVPMRRELKAATRWEKDTTGNWYVEVRPVNNSNESMVVSYRAEFRNADGTKMQNIWNLNKAFDLGIRSFYSYSPSNEDFAFPPTMEKGNIFPWNEIVESVPDDHWGLRFISIGFKHFLAEPMAGRRMYQDIYLNAMGINQVEDYNIVAANQPKDKNIPVYIPRRVSDFAKFIAPLFDVDDTNLVQNVDMRGAWAGRQRSIVYNPSTEDTDRCKFEQINPKYDICPPWDGVHKFEPSLTCPDEATYQAEQMLKSLGHYQKIPYRKRFVEDLNNPGQLLTKPIPLFEMAQAGKYHLKFQNKDTIITLPTWGSFKLPAQKVPSIIEIGQKIAKRFYHFLFENIAFANIDLNIKDTHVTLKQFFIDRFDLKYNYNQGWLKLPLTSITIDHFNLDGKFGNIAIHNPATQPLQLAIHHNKSNHSQGLDIRNIQTGPLNLTFEKCSNEKKQVNECNDKDEQINKFIIQAKQIFFGEISLQNIKLANLRPHLEKGHFVEALLNLPSLFKTSTRDISGHIAQIVFDQLDVKTPYGNFKINMPENKDFSIELKDVTHPDGSITKTLSIKNFKLAPTELQLNGFNFKIGATHIQEIEISNIKSLDKTGFANAKITIHDLDAEYATLTKENYTLFDIHHKPNNGPLIKEIQAELSLNTEGNIESATVDISGMAIDALTSTFPNGKNTKLANTITILNPAMGSLHATFKDKILKIDVVKIGSEISAEQKTSGQHNFSIAIPNKSGKTTKEFNFAGNVGLSNIHFENNFQKSPPTFSTHFDVSFNNIDGQIKLPGMGNIKLRTHPQDSHDPEKYTLKGFFKLDAEEHFTFNMNQIPYLEILKGSGLSQKLNEKVFGGKFGTSTLTHSSLHATEAGVDLTGNIDLLFTNISFDLYNLLPKLNITTDLAQAKLTGTAKLSIGKDLSTLSLENASTTTPLKLTGNMTNFDFVQTPKKYGEEDYKKNPALNVIKTDVKTTGQYEIANIRKVVFKKPAYEGGSNIFEVSIDALSIYNIAGNATLWGPVGIWGYLRGMFPSVGGSSRPPNMPPAQRLIRHLSAAEQSKIGKGDFMRIDTLRVSGGKTNRNVYMRNFVLSLHEPTQDESHPDSKNQYFMLGVPEIIGTTSQEREFNKEVKKLEAAYKMKLATGSNLIYLCTYLDAEKDRDGKWIQCSDPVPFIAK